MISKVPIIEQCTVSNSFHKEIMVEDLAGYLVRNKNLVFPHRHNFYHFVLFTKGSGFHVIDFQRFDVCPGQIYFMIPGQIHSWEFEGEMDGYIVNFDKDLFKNLLLRPDYLSNFSFFSGLVRDEVVQVDSSKLEAVIAVLERMRQQVDDRDFSSISLLYLFHLLEGKREGSIANEANVYNHTLLRNFLALIELNYKKLRLPKEYASLLYITPNHLNALCKELLGESAGEIIRNRIVLEAKRLLVIRDFSIAEIAYELNFSDNSYFTKFFKKIEGVTPEEFRKL
ncbi:helix-turn-helix domain-containing protein [Sphingobacterium rhinopitheci]|uniref:helix-turn-helix domain-containing protein n=1 Tax=Sphingobacterium rhinopitheci TaxID=2781960 RepID=UPI001F51FDB2|nr:helix-turn-helix domain-containing protein [Sphingobacterium rhinopitheci]MCI0920565.1 helix-turn-helix domain-containing protein [Sphingobacterium rhinopitheci]